MTQDLRYQYCKVKGVKGCHFGYVQGPVEVTQLNTSTVDARARLNPLHPPLESLAFEVLERFYFGAPTIDATAFAKFDRARQELHHVIHTLRELGWDIRSLKFPGCLSVAYTLSTQHRAWLSKNFAPHIAERHVP